MSTKFILKTCENKINVVIKLKQYKNYEVPSKKNLHSTLSSFQLK